MKEINIGLLILGMLLLTLIATVNANNSEKNPFIETHSLSPDREKVIHEGNDVTVRSFVLREDGKKYRVLVFDMGSEKEIRLIEIE
jgi:hypothetical protein